MSEDTENLFPRRSTRDSKEIEAGITGNRRAHAGGRSTRDSKEIEAELLSFVRELLAMVAAPVIPKRLRRPKLWFDRPPRAMSQHP